MICTAAIPLIIGIVYGVNYNVQYWKLLLASGDDMSSDYISVLAILLMLYFLIQILGIMMIAVETAKKVTGKS